MEPGFDPGSLAFVGSNPTPSANQLKEIEMKKELFIVYETPEPGSGHNFTSLIVVDPDIQLPNGNYKVTKVLMGNFADEIYGHLTKGEEE